MVVIVGIPRQLVQRLRAECGAIHLETLAVGRGPRGRVEFDLHPSVAVGFLERCSAADQEGLRLVVLPYARVPEPIAHAVKGLETSSSTTILRAQPGQDGWPSHPPSDRFDQLFLDALAGRLGQELRGLETPIPNRIPASGETRHYKKIAAGKAVDVMLETAACNHNTWQPAHRAPKASKGIEKASGGQIRKLEHCAKCTGGGRWRVRFE